MARSRLVKPAPEPPAVYARGADLFDAGAFFEAHEVWEEAWNAAEDPEERLFFQGLIQIAAAFHKLLVMRSPPSAVRLAERGLEKLHRCAGARHGLDLARFRDQVLASLPAIATATVERAAIPRAPR